MKKQPTKPKAFTMTPAFFTEIGIALYGRRWKTELGDELTRTDRTVARWATGDLDFPSEMPGVLADIIRERIVKLQALADTLDPPVVKRRGLE